MRLARSAVLSISLVAAGCGGDDDPKKPTDGGQTPSPGWRAAVGDQGTLTQTFDDVTWAARSIAATDLLGVACLGNELGWATGADGSIFHTADAVTWARQASPTREALHAVRFAHDGASHRGFAVGAKGVVVTTSDGGERWSAVPSGTERTLRGVALTHDASLVVAVGDGATVTVSRGRGTDFDATRVDGAADFTAIAMDFLGRTVLVAATDGALWRSSDGGATFALEHRTPGPLSAVAIAEDGSWALAAGDGGSILRRDERGSWREAEMDGAPDFTAALVTHDGLRGWLAGEGGVLVGTSFLDESWAFVPSGTRATLRALEDLDPR